MCHNVCRCIAVFVFIKTLPSFIFYIGLHGVFFLHGGVLMFVVVFAAILVPETKGKSLTELCSLFKKDEPPAQLDGATNNGFDST